MNQTKRIILNVVATYARSLFAIICGVFTGRWVLAALGDSAYGVFGIVGTIIGLVSVVNQILSSSVSRYFAFSVGQAQCCDDKYKAVEECKIWFNVAFLIHIIIPFLLVTLGYPLGVWSIRSYFNIPPNLIEPSINVFRFSLIATFVGMAAVPFHSLYIAHQFIAELTIYSVLQSAATLCLSWVLLSYNGDRLFFNGLYVMIVSVVPQLLIVARAFKLFPECKLSFELMLDKERYKKLFSYAGWQVIGWIGLTCRFQGLAALCNKVLGLKYNTSMTVSNTVSQHAMTFSYALNGAFVPAITNAAGAENDIAFQKLVLRSCKFGALLCSVFAIPLVVEMRYVMKLWLVKVPPQAELLCAITLITLMIERVGAGLSTAISAKGNIKLSEIVGGLIWLFSLILAMIFVLKFRMGLSGIGWSVFVCTILMVLKNAIISWKLAKVDIYKWLCGFAVPFFLVAGFSLIIGYICSISLNESFFRLLFSTVLSLLFLIVFYYLYILDFEEKDLLLKYVVSKLKIRRT